jgi:hypothetical protein
MLMSCKHALLVEVRGQGQLHQDAVDFRVGVQFFDQFFQVFLADIRGDGVMVRGHPQFGAGLLLHADVRRRVDAVADQHGRQAGLGFALPQVALRPFLLLHRAPFAQWLFHRLIERSCLVSFVKDGLIVQPHLFSSK